MIQSRLDPSSCDPGPETHTAALALLSHLFTHFLLFIPLSHSFLSSFQMLRTRKCWMHIAPPPIPLPLHWAPCRGPCRRKPVLCPFSAWAAHRSPGYGQGAAQGGVQAVARFRGTSQILGEEFSQRRGQRALDLLDKLPEGGTVLRQALEGPKTTAQSRGGVGETYAGRRKGRDKGWKSRVSVGGGAVFMVEEDLGNPVKSAFQFFDPPSQGLLGLTRGTWKQPRASRGKRSLFCRGGHAWFSLAPGTPGRA